MPPALSPIACLRIVAFLVALSPCTLAGERMALLIGNNTYDASRPADRSPNLRNAVEDATAMQKLLLEQARFTPEDVTLATNVDRATLDTVLTAFTQRAKNARLILLFYAGHGMESTNGKSNYLLPTGVISPALAESDTALAGHGVNLEQLLWIFHKAAPAANKVAILDCCRDRPSDNQGVGVAGGGMAAYPAYGIPERTVVLLAASPGRLAADGDKHGPFTQALLTELPKPKQSFGQAFVAASSQVVVSTKGSQVPWLHFNGNAGMLGGNLFSTEDNHTLPALLSNANVRFPDSLEEYLPLMTVRSTPYRWKPYPTLEPLDAAQEAAGISYWNGDGVEGEPFILVDLSHQRAWFYKGKKLVGAVAISSGAQDTPTPRGEFRVTDKRGRGRDPRYGNFVSPSGNVIAENVDILQTTPPSGTRFEPANLPWMLFLGHVTRHDMLSLHSGFLPGYPASKGDIRLPSFMAEIFYKNAPIGTKVVIRD